MSVQTPDGVVFDAVVFGEQEPTKWMAGSNGFTRTKSFGGPAEAEADKRPVHVALAIAADGTVAGFRDGRPYGKPYASSGPVAFEAGKTEVLFGLRHGPAGGNKLLTGVVVAARLYDRALSPAEVAARLRALGYEPVWGDWSVVLPATEAMLTRAGAGRSAVGP